MSIDELTATPESDATPDAKPVAIGGATSAGVLRDAWFPLARVRAITRKPIRRELDGRPIVLWRDREGALHAMEDRCAHRRAALSDGKVVGDHLHCPYHGWQYDTAGACVLIPSLGPGVTPPTRFCVETYPIVSRYGWAWVWWGDPANADEQYLPDIPFLHPDADPPGGRLAKFSYRAPQELVIENLLDLTHLDFVHGSIFGDPYGAGEEEIIVEHTDEVITMTRVSNARLPPRAQAMLTRGKRQDIYQTMQIYVRSGVAIGVAWSTPPGWGVCLFLPNVPATRDRTDQEGHLHVLGSRAAAAYTKLVLPWGSRIVAMQDARIFRGQVPNYASEGDVRADKSVPADAPGLRYRAMRRALAARQRSGDFGYAAGWRGRDAAEIHRVQRPARVSR